MRTKKDSLKNIYICIFFSLGKHVHPKQLTLNQYESQWHYDIFFIPSINLYKNTLEMHFIYLVCWHITHVNFNTISWTEMTNTVFVKVFSVFWMNYWLRSTIYSMCSCLFKRPHKYKRALRDIMITRRPHTHKNTYTHAPSASPHTARGSSQQGLLVSREIKKLLKEPAKYGTNMPSNLSK